MRGIPQLLVLFAILLLSYLMACNPATKDVTLREVKASSSKKRNKDNTQKVLLFTENMSEASNYEGINGNVPRLKAMLSGSFTAYNLDRDPERKTYMPWLINEDQDSVILCTFPIGEPSKHGHWLYMAQYLTSLPDEPIHVYFVELEEIDRDTILATYYALPEDFEHTTNDILAAPKKMFQEFDFDGLKPVDNGERIWYERRELLKYYGRSHWINTEDPLRADLKDGFNRDYYVVTPGRYHFGKEYYDKSKEFIARTQGYRLVRHKILSKKHRGT